MSDEKKLPDPSWPEGEGPDEDPEPEAPKKGLAYEFKIAPADPKNSFDFEDVADK